MPLHGADGLGEVTMLARRILLSCAAGILAIASASHAFAADYEWKFFTFFAVNDMPTNFHRQFAEDLTKATGGRLKVSVYAGGELPYKISDVLRVVANDQVQLGDISPGAHLGEMPGMNVFDVPFACTSMAGFAKAVDAARPTIDGYLKDKYDVVALLHWTMPAQQLWLSKKPRSLDDIKGNKLRMWSRMHTGMLQKLGATGVTISAAEVVAAIDRKVIDGAITATIPANDWRLYDSAKYGYLLSFQLGHQLIGVNGSEFRKLPADLQKIVLAKSAEWQGRYIKAIEEADLAARARFKEKGGDLVEPTDADRKKARELMQPILDQWAKENGEIAQKLLTAVSNACNG
jgi:TRAP-type C4-dicarboxylate transport system substrate-binding protein